MADVKPGSRVRFSKRQILLIIIVAIVFGMIGFALSIFVRPGQQYYPLPKQVEQTMQHAGDL
jgi:hypothetical protein